MPDLENYILSAIFFFLLCAVFYFWKMARKKKEVSSQQKFVMDTIALARSQFEIFNLKPNAGGEARNGISAILEDMDKDGLQMDAGCFVPKDLAGKETDVYFRARQDSGPVFYVFKSVIKNVQSDYEHSRLVLSVPTNLRVEKKRHFIRVKPHKNDVRIIGVWPIKPGTHLPKSTASIGSPLTHYQHGRDTEPVQVENISASGIALRFKLDKDGNPPVEFRKGSQLLCLVVYTQDDGDAKPTAFWCTGEIMNSRKAAGLEPELVLGLEYTNWAVLEQGTSEIHWTHSSPTRGARPILQWVEKIDKSKKDYEG